MQKKAVFYVLSESTQKARDLYACRIVEKAYSNKCSVFVSLNTAEDVRNFDTQLWTFRDVSFVPHEIYNPKVNDEIQILIACCASPECHTDLLVNLKVEVSAFYLQFRHIIEVVQNEPESKKLARQRYQIYQKNGYKMESFNI